jgi:hypothetical protein
MQPVGLANTRISTDYAQKISPTRVLIPIAMFCGTNNIMWNIPHIQPEYCEEYSIEYCQSHKTMLWV